MPHAVEIREREEEMRKLNLLFCECSCTFLDQSGCTQVHYPSLDGHTELRTVHLKHKCDLWR